MNPHSTTTPRAGQPPANVVPFPLTAAMEVNEMIEAAQEMHRVLYGVLGRWVLRCVSDVDVVR